MLIIMHADGDVAHHHVCVGDILKRYPAEATQESDANMQKKEKEASGRIQKPYLLAQEEREKAQAASRPEPPAPADGRTCTHAHAFTPHRVVVCMLVHHVHVLLLMRQRLHDIIMQ